jgi:hypothetical protein
MPQLGCISGAGLSGFTTLTLGFAGLGLTKGTSVSVSRWTSLPNREWVSSTACRIRTPGGGNAGLAAGAGWMKEFELLGVPFEVRGRLTDECLAAACSPGPPQTWPTPPPCRRSAWATSRAVSAAAPLVPCSRRPRPSRKKSTVDRSMVQRRGMSPMAERPTWAPLPDLGAGDGPSSPGGGAPALSAKADHR